MDTVDLDLLLDLGERTGGDRMSLYMPTQRFGPGSQEADSARMKNLLRAAAASLEERGRRPAEVESFLAPADALLTDRPLWLRSRESLAVLLGPEGMRTVQADIAVPESVYVGDRYHLLPLVALTGLRDRFWLLALSQKRVRLFEGSRATLTEVPTTGIPQSLADAMQWEDFEKASLQFHTGTSGSGGRRPAVFHGTGETDFKKELVRFFRDIDRGLHDHLGASGEPLVLAGVDYLLSLYREVNSYPHLAGMSVAGNPDALGEQALHEQGWRVIEALLAEERSLLARAIDDAWASPKVSADPAAIVESARAGRVETLLFSQSARWEAVGGPLPGGDPLEGAALDTLRNGGRVAAYPPDELIHGHDVVALLRY